MVGMSGKSGEPRRGQALRNKGSSPSTKPQPPAEALQMARILGDQSPPDISDKVQQVRAVVPGRSEEDICIALHDNDFDPEKAISALLDSETGEGEWMRKERKGKKKGQGEIDLVVGDTKLRQAGVRTLGTTKTAPSRGGVAGGGRRSQTSGRARSSSSGRRGERIRPPGRGGRIGARERTKPPAASSQIEPGSTDRGLVTEESWDVDEQQHIETETWGDPLLSSHDHWEHHVQPELAQPWERDSPVFPEAIPPSHQFLPVASTAESTSTAATTMSPDRYQLTPLEHRPLGTFVLEQKPPGKPSVTRNKHKRIARSEIPTKPVEMPGSIDALDVEFGSLGIDFFIGAEPEPPVSDITQPSVVSTSTELEAITSTTKLEDVTPLLTVQHFTDDPGVISMTYPQSETKAPPGLTHPSEQQQQKQQQQEMLPPPEPISLPPQSENSSALSAPSLPPLPRSIELPRPTTETVTTVEQTKLTPHIFTPVASTTTSLLLTATQTHTSPTTLTASTGTRASHSSQQGKHGQPHPNPNMLAYQMMTPQYFMPMSYYGDPSEMSRYQSVYYQQHPGASSDLSGAPGLTRDHSTMETSKFPGRADVTTSANTQQQTQQGGLQQGQQIGPAFVNPGYPYSQMLYPGWYHTAMGMAGFSAAASMGPKPSVGTSYPGVSTYQASSPGAFGMPAGYDETGGHDFPRMYHGSSMPKSSGVPSTSGMSDLSNASFKHQQFDSKSGSNYYQMGSSAGGYMGGFMQVPGLPMHHLPVVPPHDNTQTRGQMQKHSKQSYGGGLAWPQGT